MRLTHDLETNSLRLMLDEPEGEIASLDRLPGVIDVAENGRLVGVELQFASGHDSVARQVRRWTDDPVAGEFVSVEPSGTVYIELTAGGEDDLILSSPLDLTLEFDSGGEMLAVAIPRRGEGYEISYPSGNR